MKRVRIPVTVVYSGYYDFRYVDTFDMDAIMNEDLVASPENKEAHWKHELKKIKASIKKEIEEYGVYDVLIERSITCSVTVWIETNEEKGLRAIFDRGYAELKETSEGDENEL